MSAMQDIVDDLLDYEEGRMDDDQVIAFFQRLVDTGLAWRLQGGYGRTASMLLLQGHVTRPGQPVQAMPGHALPHRIQDSIIPGSAQ